MSAGRFVYFRQKGTWPKLQSLPANQNDASYSANRQFAPNTVLQEHHVRAHESCRLMVRQKETGLTYSASILSIHAANDIIRNSQGPTTCPFA
jgi:hypothetical protein